MVFGRAGGFAANLDLSSLEGSNGFEIRGVSTGDQSGFAVSAAGDVNGDGLDDLLIGSYLADPNGTSSGASYVIFGRADWGRAEPTEGNDTLIGSTGDDAIDALGGDDEVRGLQGNDTLVGGAGNDTLFGGAGDDIHVVDQQGEAVEATDEGTDTVRSSVSYTLGDHLENLILLRSASTGTGNGLGNVITGNSSDNGLSGGDGADRLDGSTGSDTLEGGSGDDTLEGGAGLDTLVGGLGNDAFYFAAPNLDRDKLTEFFGVTGNNDFFLISAAGFGGGLVAGTTLSASQFQIRADNRAQDSDDRFIFNFTTDELWYDRDGTGAAEAVLVVDIAMDATVTSADILLV